MSDLSHPGVSSTGLVAALRRVRDPVLFLGLPFAFVAMSIAAAPSGMGDVGFDFVGTLWDPARALLDGVAIYPEPTRAAIEIGNPAVYPPPFILAALPLALLPAQAAAWIWWFVLLAAVMASLRIVGVRDWRCYVLAATSPVVLHGLFWGNLTLLLMVPVALAWRYRDRALAAGLALGVGIAAKLFLWPLLAWLVLTRRFKAAAVGAAAALAVVFGSWALIGFEGMRSYPALLRAVQDVYATRSYSLASVAGGLGASDAQAVAVCTLAGLGLLGLAAFAARRADADRRVFALGVAACIVASPIVWPNYAALLFVPVAVTWPRFSLAWLFGYPIWLAGLLPKPRIPVPEPCCRPADVPEQVWALSHAVPVPWFAAGVMAVVLAVALGLAVAARAAERSLG